jgi:hypothetical protein
MFEMLCKGVRQEMRHGHRPRRPPPTAAGRRGSPRVVVVVVVVRWHFSAGRGEDDGNDGMGDTFVTTTTTMTDVHNHTTIQYLIKSTSYSSYFATNVAPRKPCGIST